MSKETAPKNPGGPPHVSGELTASLRKSPPASVSGLSADGRPGLDPISINSAEIIRADLSADQSADALTREARRGNSFASESGTAKNPKKDGSAYSAAPSEISDEDTAARRHQPAEGALPPHERPFGDYTLLRRLAFGGMGEVFLARRDSDGVMVVVKRVLAHMRRDEKHRRMFLDEARLQKMLASRHIVEVTDTGEHDGITFLVMEHVHGPSWRAVIDRCRQRKQHIPVAYVVDMMAQAASALSYAHNLRADDGHPLKIVHRDINPHNVLVTYDGTVKLIDFGIAKSELREQQTETGTIKGKFAYMSPEQSAAEPLDARSDLFALGICLYELICLHNPFKRSNVVLSLEAIQKMTPKPFAEARATATVLDPIVERMLRKNPDDRFFDCGEVQDALIQLRRDGLLPEPQRPLREWLRELFVEELADHERVLREVGINLDDDSPSLSPMPLSRPFGEGSVTRTRPLDSSERRSIMSDPIDVGPNIGDDIGDDDISDDETVGMSDTLFAAEREPATVVPDDSSDGTGPTGALKIVPQKQRSSGLLAAGVALSTAVVVAGVMLAIRPPPPTEPTTPQETPPVGIVVAPPPQPPEQPVDDPEPPQPPQPPAPPAPPPVVEDPPPAPPPLLGGPGPKKPKNDPKPKQPPPPPIVLAGKVTVSADGHIVKGGRNVPEGGVLTMTVDDKDAPFRVVMKVKENGMSLSTTPWAIVRVDQVGKGKTPLADVPITPGKKHLISLQNPDGKAMELSLTYVPTQR